MANRIGRSKIIKFCTLYAMFFLLSFCSDDLEYYVPEVPVYMELDINTDLQPLGVGESVIIVPDSADENNGVLLYPNLTGYFKYHIPWEIYGKGVVLYREDFLVYRAYDRTCTYKPLEEYCGVELKKNILVPECPCCGSKFMLTADGVPTKDSKADKPLFPLKTIVTDNGKTLVITKL